MNVLAEFTAWYTWMEIGLGLIVMFIVTFRPQSFWSMLFISAIFGQGPRFMGYHFLDEYLVMCVVIGALARIAFFRTRRSLHVYPSQQKLIFYVWLGYMIVESIVGIYLNSDLRIIRWVFFYMLLGFLAFIVCHYEDEFPFPSLKHALKVILVTTGFYLTLYLGVGFIYDYIFESAAMRWHSQFMRHGFVWSGTGCAVFPKIIAMPAAIVALNEKLSIRMKILASLVLLLMLYSGFYYDSRMSYVVVVGVVAVSLYRMKIRNILLAIFMFVAVFVYHVDSGGRSLTKFFTQLYYGTQSLWIEDDEKNTDLSRKLQFEAGFLRLLDSPVTFLVGDGVYSHRFTTIPHIERLYAINLPASQFKKPSGSEKIVDDDHEDNWGSLSIFRTTGFTALLVDTGIIGMFLFMLNFVVVAKILFKQKNKYKILLLFILTLAFFWLFVVNIVDVMMFYLLIMPRGILERLGEGMAEMKLRDA